MNSVKCGSKARRRTSPAWPLETTSTACNNHRMRGVGALLVGVAIGLAACAGRDAQPTSTVQPQDAYSTCDMINAEIQANNKRAEALATEQNWKVAQNVATGVAGIVIWPLWFAMDTKGAAGTEAAALQARQQYLASLASMRCQQQVVETRR